MKNIQLFLFATLFLVSSCSKAEVDDTPSMLPTFDYEFTTAVNEEEPKVKFDKNTRVDFNTDNLQYSWDVTDKILMVYSPTDEQTPNYQIFADNSGVALPFESQEAGLTTCFKIKGTTATFDVTKIYNYKAIYPFPEQAITPPSAIQYKIPVDQTSSFDGRYNLMYATAENAEGFFPIGTESVQKNPPRFTFKQLTTQVAFYIKTANVPQDVEITGIEVEFPKGTGVVGELNLNPFTNDYTVAITKGTVYDRVRVKFPVSVKPTDHFVEEQAAILTCLPFTVKAHDTFKVTILAKSQNFNDVRETIDCTPTFDLTCEAGDFQVINLTSKGNFEFSNKIKPTGGNSIQDLLGTTFAPAVTTKDKGAYHTNDYTYFSKVGDIMAASSFVTPIYNTETDKEENVIVMDNTVVVDSNKGNNSSFYLPINKVLPNFLQDYNGKDLLVRFKAYVVFCGHHNTNVKSAEPIYITLNHCDTSTIKDRDSGCKRIGAATVPVENIHYSVNDYISYINSGGAVYPKVNEHAAMNQGWMDYEVVIPSKYLQPAHFASTDDYIGFRIDNWDYDGPSKMLVYIKDVEYSATEQKPNIWMKDINYNPFISEMSLPATHDSATSPISSATMRCQDFTLDEQLNLGVRVFDLRPTDTPKLMINHGSTSTGVTFDAAIQTIKTFVTEHPSEFCVITMKEENGGRNSDWATKMAAYLKTIDRNIFIDFRQNFKLNDVRGKVLLLSRTTYYSIEPQHPYVGGLIGTWGNGTNDDMVNIQNENEIESLFVQDNYWTTTTYNRKKTVIMNYFKKAATKDAHAWLFNYLSQAGNPEEYCKTYNKYAWDYLMSNEANGKNVGIVFMDFAGYPASNGQLVVQEIINQNFEGR